MEYHNFSNYLNIELGEVNENSANGKMKTLPELTDHLGHVTGGAYTSLADAVGGALARATGDLYVTQGCSMTFYVSTLVSDEYLYAKASLRHRGSRTCIVWVELYKKDGTIVSDGQMSYAKVPKE